MLKQRFLLQFGSNAIVYITGMLAGILVARIAGPSVVGIITYGTSFAGILGFINGLFGSAHIKLVSEGKEHADCLGVYSRLQAGSAVVYLIVMAGWFLTQKYLLRNSFESVQVEIVVILAILAHFIGQYEQYANVVYTANLKQAKANIPTFFRNLSWHLGRVALVILGFRAVAMSAWNLFLGIAVSLFLYFLLREFPKNKYDPKLAKEYIRYAVPIFIIVFVNAITGNAGKLFLAHYTNTTNLGYYSAAYSLGGMFMLIAMPVGSIFFPLFSRMIAKGDWAGVNTNIRKYQEFIILFVFPAICALAVAGGPLLVLVLGSRYQPSVNPFVVLLFATYVVLLGLPYGNIISGMGKFYLSAWINVIKLAVFVVSITVFVSPKFLNLGATGVAINLLVLNLTANGLYLYFSKKHGDVRMSIKNNIRHMIIILITIIGYFVSIYLSKTLQLWWLIYLPVNLLVIYTVLKVFGLIGKEHWLLLLEAANMKKTLKYANNEFKENS